MLRCQMAKNKVPGDRKHTSQLLVSEKRELIRAVLAYNVFQAHATRREATHRGLQLVAGELTFPRNFDESPITRVLLILHKHTKAHQQQRHVNML